MQLSTLAHVSHLPPEDLLLCAEFVSMATKCISNIALFVVPPFDYCQIDALQKDTAKSNLSNLAFHAKHTCNDAAGPAGCPGKSAAH